MRKILIHIALIIMLFSCEEKIDFDAESQETIRLVVEGMITNEIKAHEVKLSLPVKNLNEAAQPVSGAFVAITDQQNTFILQEDPENPGLYFTDNSVQGVFGKFYTLYIRIQDYEFTGSSFMVPVEPMQPLNISGCDDSAEIYNLVTIENGDPFMMEIDYDWSSAEDCPSNMCNAREVVYYLNSVDVNDIFKPEQEKVCFPPGTMIRRTKYSLNDNFQSYIRAMMNETNWRGGIFDVERGNIPTNMSLGAIGYFAAASVVSDSTVYQP